MVSLSGWSVISPGPVLPIKERSAFVPVEFMFKKGFMTSS